MARLDSNTKLFSIDTNSAFTQLQTQFAEKLKLQESQFDELLSPRPGSESWLWRVGKLTMTWVRQWLSPGTPILTMGLSRLSCYMVEVTKTKHQIQ